MSQNQNSDIESLVGPGYRVYDSQLSPPLTGSLEIESDILAGGILADVFQGKWVVPGQPQMTVAIKRVRIPGKNVSDAQFQTRIKRETVIWEMAKHDNILPFLGYQIDTKGRPLLVSPWCKNGNLEKYIEAHSDLSENARYRLLYGASRGIAYLHGLGTPIVHGDIKPENIMIQNNEEAGICDFGISKILVAHGQRSGLTTSGNTPGTCRFQAPEVLENDPATTSSDVFALAGVILFGLSGKAPFGDQAPWKVYLAVTSGETPDPEDHSKLSKADPIWPLLKQCWAFQPQERPGTLDVLSMLKEKSSS